MADPVLIEVPGKGITDLTAIRIDKAVRHYDRYLRFGYNPENQDYILYVVMPRDFDSYYFIDGEPAYPVIGFGKEIPSEDHVLARLRASDVRKRGVDVLNALNRHNEQLRRANDLVAAGPVEEAAERIEHLVRSLGMTEKYGKVVMHVPKSRNKR
jgi:hypothetical protein